MKKIIFTLLLTIISATALAAGPFTPFDVSGGGRTARVWNGTVKWQYDPDKLNNYPALPTSDAIKAKCEKDTAGNSHLACSSMPVCGVVMCIDELFKRWTEKQASLFLGDGETSIKVSNIKVVYDGPFAENFTKDNFSTTEGYHGEKPIPPNTILIVFDNEPTEGPLVSSEYGGVLGLTTLSPDFSDTESKYYSGGWVILNGAKATDIDFPAAILHEFGHALGLDHTQGPKDSMDAANNEKDARSVPTMYPFLLDPEQADLHNDDIISLAMLYPTDGFKNNFCKIEGDLVDKDGKPYQGVNVVAYKYGDAQFIDSRSFVSGALYPPCSDNAKSGHYVLPGLVPGIPYRVVYEPVYPDFRNFTYGMNPYNDDVCKLTPGLEDSGVVTFGGKELVACSAKTIGDIPEEYTPDSSGLVNSSIVAGILPESVYVDTKGTINAGATGLTTTPVKEEASSGKKPWCGSTLMGSVSPVWGGLMPLVVGVLLALRLRKQNL